jgi:hypothetical protein
MLASVCSNGKQDTATTRLTERSPNLRLYHRFAMENGNPRLVEILLG